MHGRGAIHQPATSLRRKLALPLLAAMQSEALSSSPLTPAAGMLTGSRNHRQWPVSARAQGVCYVQETPFHRHSLISGSDPCCLVQCFLSLVDSEDRDVPRGAGPSPCHLFSTLSLVTSLWQLLCPGEKGCPDGSRERVALFPEFNDKCLEDNLMPCLLSKTTRVESI